MAGGSAERVIKAQADKCKADGKEPVEVQSYTDQPSSILAVRSKRADAFFSSQAPLTYFVSQANGQLELTGVGQKNGFEDIYPGRRRAEGLTARPAVRRCHQGAHGQRHLCRDHEEMGPREQHDQGARPQPWRATSRNEHRQKQQAQPPSGAADFRDVATAHTPFRAGRSPSGRDHAGRRRLRLDRCANENFGWPIVAPISSTARFSAVFTSALASPCRHDPRCRARPGGAIARMSSDKLASSFGVAVHLVLPRHAAARAADLLVQLSTLFPQISMALPFGPTLASWDTNSVITPMTAAIVGLALNEAAYMAEIIRGGLLSVDRGQAETAEAFGMTKGRALRRIIIPQAMRSIVPPTGNQLISMIKATSLVSVIAMADLLYSVQSIYNRTFEIIPMLLVAVLWYLLITSVLNVGQGYIEAYYSRGERRNGATPASSRAEEASR
jgi:polar amino acid transport system permease protein